MQVTSYIISSDKIMKQAWEEQCFHSCNVLGIMSIDPTLIMFSASFILNFVSHSEILGNISDSGSQECFGHW